MANTNTNVLPKLMAQGLLALRQNVQLPRLVNGSYSGLAAQEGDIINVPIPSAITVRTVTPAVTQAANQDWSPTNAAVTLDFWREASFQLSDKDEKDVISGAKSMAASEAIKAIANACDTYIMGKATGIYGLAGTPGTAPFSGSLNMAVSARQLLNEQLAPVGDRRVVIDPTAESNLLLNSEVLKFNERGDGGGIIRGEIGTKLGFDWYMDQNITSFTPGTGWVTGYTISTVSGLAGEATLNITNTTASGTVLVGDIFTLGGQAQQYVVTAAATASATVPFAISINPALATSHATAIALTVVGTAYTRNLAFHRDAFAWASRPMGDIGGYGANFMAKVDPVSSIALRLEVSRQYKQTTFAFDILAGSNLIRPELAAIIAGQ
jgi:hypothetical protein